MASYPYYNGMLARTSLFRRFTDTNLNGTGSVKFKNKKHLKNVGPIRYCEPPHCHSPGVATVARRLSVDVHHNNDDDNA